ncbi:ATP-binding protein [Bradyrhizobium sp. USDA 4011]
MSRRAAPRPDGPRRRSACGARPAPSARPEDGADRGSKPRTSDTRHCDAVSTSNGKTWLACAFGRQAARLDHSVLHLRMPGLFEALAMARLDGRCPRLSTSSRSSNCLSWTIGAPTPSMTRRASTSRKSSKSATSANLP